MSSEQIEKHLADCAKCLESFAINIKNNGGPRSYAIALELIEASRHTLTASTLISEANQIEANLNTINSAEITPINSLKSSSNSND